MMIRAAAAQLSHLPHNALPYDLRAPVRWPHLPCSTGARMKNDKLTSAEALVMTSTLGTLALVLLAAIA